jgi:hypothetical protein
MAEAMVAAVDEPVSAGKERIAWATGRTWERRTEAWLDATLGRCPADVTGVTTTTTP